MAVNVTIPDAQMQALKAALDSVSGSEANNAAAGAINQALVTVRKPMLEAISTKAGLLLSTLRRASPIFKANKSRLSGIIRFTGGAHGINLAGFDSTKATYPTKSGGVSSPFGSDPHAFIMRPRIQPKTSFAFEKAKFGSKLAVHRAGEARAAKGGRYAGKLVTRGPRKGQPVLRQGIKPNFGPTASELAQQTPEVASLANKDLGDLLTLRITQQIQFRLEKAAKKGAQNASH